MRLFTDVSTVKGVSNIIIDKLTIPFVVGFKSEDLTGALKVFGYDNDLTSRKTEITYDVSWQGGPLDFSIKPLTGRIEAKMEKGQLAKGLTFDQFKSTFAIKAGEARAHGSVRYDAPSVVVEATGWTDLEQETYDLTALITANRTQTAPVYVMPSAPGADWITFPKEKPTSKQASLVSITEYSITGPWKSPNIVKRLVTAKPLHKYLE